MQEDEFKLYKISKNWSTSSHSQNNIKWISVLLQVSTNSLGAKAAELVSNQLALNLALVEGEGCRSLSSSDFFLQGLHLKWTGEEWGAPGWGFMAFFSQALYWFIWGETWIFFMAFFSQALYWVYFRRNMNSILLLK